MQSKHSVFSSINSATRTTFDHLVSLPEQFSAHSNIFNVNLTWVYVICDLFPFIIRKNTFSFATPLFVTTTTFSHYQKWAEKKINYKATTCGSLTALRVINSQFNINNIRTLLSPFPNDCRSFHYCRHRTYTHIDRNVYGFGIGDILMTIYWS